MKTRFYQNREGQVEAIVKDDNFFACFIQYVDFELVELVVDGVEVEPTQWSEHRKIIDLATDKIYNSTFNYRLTA